MVTMRVYAHILPSLDERLSDGLEQTSALLSPIRHLKRSKGAFVEIGDR